MKNPKNTHALTLFLLIENRKNGVTNLDAMNVFHSKFSTRLGELQRSYPALIIKKELVTKTNRFNHSSTFMNYKCLNKITELKNIYNKINT